jgi:hypothetical protein
LNGYLVQDVAGKNDQLIAPVTTNTTTDVTAPEGVQATATSTTTVNVSWQAVTGASGYVVFQQINGSWTQVAAVNGAGSGNVSATINNETPGQQATFVVEAYNATTQATSSPVTTTMPGDNQVSPPTNVSIWQSSASSATLTWSPAANATSYGIYYWNGYRWRLLGSVNGASTGVTINGLQPGETYYFQVVAFNATSYAAAQNFVSVTTSAAPNWGWLSGYDDQASE